MADQPTHSTEPASPAPVDLLAKLEAQIQASRLERAYVAVQKALDAVNALQEEDLASAEGNDSPARYQLSRHTLAVTMANSGWLDYLARERRKQVYRARKALEAQAATQEEGNR